MVTCDTIEVYYMHMSGIVNPMTLPPPELLNRDYRIMYILCDFGIMYIYTYIHYEHICTFHELFLHGLIMTVGRKSS